MKKSAKTEEIELRLLLEAIYAKYQYDFRDYSLASVKRRLNQARELFGCSSFSALQEKALHDETMLPRLLSFLTVQVSEMFRDPSYFLAVREKVVPILKTYPSLRVWVAGCSAGEELYSLAIIFREEGIDNRVILYGTDINREALRRAESGVYELDRIALFSENYRKSGGKGSLVDYYTAAYGSARFNPMLRKNVVLSDHSLATDSVFAETHFVSCRNVLIYFDRRLQDRAIGLFRDSLVRKSFLGLGIKESLRLSAHASAFSEFSREERIYQKKHDAND